MYNEINKALREADGWLDDAQGYILDCFDNGMLRTDDLESLVVKISNLRKGIESIQTDRTYTKNLIAERLVSMKYD